MKLNSIQPSPGSARPRRRVGRGIGSGLGKTAGRGHKGQKSRSGGFHKVGFEGGQMPLQRRLPKRGFKSRSQCFRSELTLAVLDTFPGAVADMVTLKNLGLISRNAKTVKIIATGVLTKKLDLVGITVSSSAREAILQAGGSIT